jgi:O-antigen ligase
MLKRLFRRTLLESDVAVGAPAAPGAIDRCALVAVGLLWTLPFLVGYSSFPIPTFYKESLALLLGICAMAPLAGSSFWRDPRVPPIAAMPFALMAIVVAQAVLRRLPFGEQALMPGFFLLWVGVLMVLGRYLKQRFGLRELVRVLAIVLVVGSELSAAIGLLQWRGLPSVLGFAILPMSSGRVSGNLAPGSNLFANYTTLGLVSLGWLYTRYGWGPIRTVGLALPLLAVMTLSGSRSAPVFLFGLAVTAFAVGQKDRLWKPLQRFMVAAIIGLAVMTSAFPLLWSSEPVPRSGVNASSALGESVVPVPGAPVAVTVSERLFAQAVDENRLYLFRNAVAIFLKFPVLGAGYGQFAWQNFLLGPEMSRTTLEGLFDNAHNLFLHIGAELGGLGLIALIVPLVMLVRSIRTESHDIEWWWAPMLLLVEAIHSMLEFPMWYAHFLGIAALAFGFIDGRSYRLQARSAGRLVFASVAVVCLVILVRTGLSYRHLELVLARRPTMQARSVVELAGQYNYARELQAGLLALGQEAMLRPYARIFMTLMLDPDDRFIEQKRQQVEPALRFIPTSAQVEFEIVLLARSGDLDQAKKMLDCAMWAFPERFEAFSRDLETLSGQDPSHFSPLVEFGSIKYDAYKRAVAAAK